MILHPSLLTERQAREDELRLLEASIARINDSIVITNANVSDTGGPQIVFVNQAFEKITGFCSSEVVGKTPRIFQGPGTDRAELARIKKSLLRGEAVRAELLNYTKDNTPYWIEVDISPIHSVAGDITHFVAVERDITERRARDQALQDAVLRAEQASVSKGQFLANMSHEIRTPMNAIIGMLSLLHQTNLTPKQLDYADKSHNAALSLLGLINDILDFSKAEAGKMTLDPQPFRVDALIRDLAVILSANVGSKGIEVVYDIAHNVPPVLLGDSMRLQQILINLAGNAIKFTEHGQVVIAIHVARVSSDAVALQFAVQDSGIGIAPENQARIFAGFSQAEASITRKFGGTGLGLAISRHLIGIMGGELQLKSALGEGSTFTFALDFPLVKDVPPGLQTEPRLSAPPKRVLVMDDTPVARKRRLQGLRILVVEDNLINQQVAQELLMSEGALVSLAANGQLGVEAVQAAAPPFDAVLMDLQMPVMDGFAATRVIRDGLQLTGLPIIAMTANAMASDRDECMAAGMNEHVGKPFNLTELVNTLLRFTRPAAELEANATPTIALAEALERMSGMQALYLRAAREFVDSLPGVVADFRRSVPGDLVCAVMHMHTLKGTSALLGATALSTLAASLEQLCMGAADAQAIAQASAPLESLVHSTTQALQRVIEELEHSAWLQAQAQAQATPYAPHPGGDTRHLRPHLEELQALLAQSNLAALEKFAEIRAPLGALPEAQLRPLEDALQNLALEDAHACCQAILDSMVPASS